MRGDANPGRRYAANLAAIYTTCLILGLTAGTYLPHPLAVMTLTGALVATATAPFITPIREPPHE